MMHDLYDGCLLELQLNIKKAIFSHTSHPSTSWPGTGLVTLGTMHVHVQFQYIPIITLLQHHNPPLLGSCKYVFDS